MNMYIGLDTATTTGISIYNPVKNVAVVYESKGKPTEQLIYIINNIIIYEKHSLFPYVFVMEKQHDFRNANTTRDLIERYGYLKYSLLDRGYTVHEVSPSPVRKYFGVKSKEDVFRLFIPRFKGSHLTDNHTDALAVALYQAHADGCSQDLANLKIGNG